MKQQDQKLDINEKVVYTFKGSDFYHLDPNCYCLYEKKLIPLESEDLAIAAGKIKCKFCNK